MTSFAQTPHFSGDISTDSQQGFGFPQKIKVLKGELESSPCDSDKSKRERRGFRFCTDVLQATERGTEVPAGSVVTLQASPIGLSGKAGMRERDWNRKTRGKKKAKREFLWLGTAHRERRGLSCVYSVKQLETSPLLGAWASDLLMFHSVFCSQKQLLTQSIEQKEKEKLSLINNRSVCLFYSLVAHLSHFTLLLLFFCTWRQTLD